MTVLTSARVLQSLIYNFIDLVQVKEMAGFAYNPLTGRWSLSDDISVNFIAFGTKPVNIQIQELPDTP